jgi:hypothetical protein
VITRPEHLSEAALTRIVPISTIAPILAGGITLQAGVDLVQLLLRRSDSPEDGILLYSQDVGDVRAELLGERKCRRRRRS